LKPRACQADAWHFRREVSQSRWPSINDGLQNLSRQNSFEPWNRSFLSCSETLSARNLKSNRPSQEYAQVPFNFLQDCIGSGA